MRFCILAWASLAVLGGVLSGPAGVPEAAAAEKVIYMQALEPKGTTSAGKEPFPGNTLPPGGGYVIKPPDKAGKWQVSTYIFHPAQVIVRQGDRVTLKILGINGAKHTVTIDRYQQKGFVITRGRVTTVSFTADRAGSFAIRCSEHPPSMTGELIVLER